MKKMIIAASLVLGVVFGASAQLEKPVTWSYVAKKKGNEATIYIKAVIDNGWHVYSQNIKPGGPTPTAFTFSPSKEYKLVGKTIEPKPITKFEKVFDQNVSYFEKAVVFQQKVKLNKATTNVKAKVEFMVCDDSRCLPPDEVEFTIPVK